MYSLVGLYVDLQVKVTIAERKKMNLKKNVWVVDIPLVGRHVVNESKITGNVGCHVVNEP